MERSKIKPDWPNALRWFLAQDLCHFAPWHFLKEPRELEFAADAFKQEDLNTGEVFVFARREDCDDFAGLAVVSGKITNKVLHFHPVFGRGPSDSPSPRTHNIVCGKFEDVFEFVAQRVIPDMKDWALHDDASEL